MGNVCFFWRERGDAYAGEGACGAAFVAAVRGGDYLLGVHYDVGEGGVYACEVLGYCL